MTQPKSPSERTRVRRVPQRGRYDRETIYGIVDAALSCHVGLVAEGQPIVIPTIHFRIADELFIQGSAAARLLECGGAGAPLCVTVTLLDGIVLARPSTTP